MQGKWEFISTLRLRSHKSLFLWLHLLYARSIKTRLNYIKVCSLRMMDMRGSWKVFTWWFKFVAFLLLAWLMQQYQSHIPAYAHIKGFVSINKHNKRYNWWSQKEITGKSGSFHERGNWEKERENSWKDLNFIKVSNKGRKVFLYRKKSFNSLIIGASNIIDSAKAIKNDIAAFPKNVIICKWRTLESWELRFRLFLPPFHA